MTYKDRIEQAIVKYYKKHGDENPWCKCGEPVQKHGRCAACNMKARRTHGRKRKDNST